MLEGDLRFFFPFCLFRELRTEYDEVTHAYRLHMEKDQENMEMELEEKTATYFLNSLKFNYNYQVLEKKNTENVDQMVYEDKKKNWVKLMNSATDLRGQIKESKSVFETKRYEIADQSEKIRDRISKLDVKIKNAAAENESKVSSVRFYVSISFNKIRLQFQNILKMNIEEANHLLSQICGFNKIFFEEHLGIRWELPDFRSLVDSNVAVLQKSEMSMNKSMLSIRNEQKGNGDNVNGTENPKLFQHVFEAMSAGMGYLMDKDLPEVLELCEMMDKDKKMSLIKLDNVFSVSQFAF